MGKIEFIENQISFDCYENSYGLDSTNSESANYISKRNTNTILPFLIAGTLLTSTPVQAKFVSNFQLTESCENIVDIQSYNNNIEIPINQYINQVNQIFNTKRYSKMEIVKDIISYRCLTEKWDGYSALPLEVESASNAILLLDLVGDKFTSKLIEFFPNTNGTLSFLWENDSKESISLEVGNKDVSYFVELNSQEPLFFNNVNINDKEAAKLSEFIQVL